MKSKFNQKAPNWPTDAQSVKSLERFIELEEIGDSISKFFLGRFLVGRPLPGNFHEFEHQWPYPVWDSGFRYQPVPADSNRVVVSFFRGFSNFCPPMELASFRCPPGVMTVDFASSETCPTTLPAANAISTPELNFHEGRAMVSSVTPRLASVAGCTIPPETRMTNCSPSQTQTSWFSAKATTEISIACKIVLNPYCLKRCGCRIRASFFPQTLNSSLTLQSLSCTSVS